MGEDALSPDHTISIVLGASAWPDFDAFQSSEAFRNSAEAFRDYSLAASGLNLPKKNLKYLFDTHNDPPDVLDEIVRFTGERISAIEKRTTGAINLIVYYVGHGGFANPASDYFLAMRSTRHSDPYISSLPITSLSRALNAAGRHIRRYLILDCCFAAAAYRFFQSEGPLGVAAVKVADAFPRSGTALLCASGARDPAKSPAHLSRTMFTGALLSVLEEGFPSGPQQLSLQDVGYLVRRRIAEEFADEGVRPEVLAPEQRYGRVDEIPIFPNAAAVRLASPELSGEVHPELTPSKPQKTPVDPSSEIHVKPIRRKRASAKRPRQVQADTPEVQPSAPSENTDTEIAGGTHLVASQPPTRIIAHAKEEIAADPDPVVVNEEFLCTFTLNRPGLVGLNKLAVYLNGLQDEGSIASWRANGWDDINTKSRAVIRFKSRADAMIAIKSLT
ncbi:hypothetical protein JQ615_01195 [Bradyrhizobium jicamae]|uniref:Caspase family p20 domain-containing protein n=1 Tax=Bradyrhizobium jicamae TaxID=280332 RepID=A0ABS5FB41_9BRAD|nr:hypothetical protein [Bradyrhizobium jicamae]MBR0793997.1 hypothetical protein [Bradyrhizobium jicamae]